MTRRLDVKQQMDRKRQTGLVGFLFLFAFFLLPFPAFSQVKTTVTDNLLGPDGSPANGTMTISAAGAFQSADGHNVAQGWRIQMPVSNGSFTVSLIPNQGATPSGANDSYVVVYNLTSSLGTSYWSETWFVPSNGPVGLAAVRTLPTFPATFLPPQAPNTVLSGPATGSSPGTASFRTLVCADLPSGCGGGSGGSMTWPGGAGVPVYSGTSSWGTSLGTSGSGSTLCLTASCVMTAPSLGTPSYLNAANITNVPYSALTGTPPMWNQNTTGNAATATALTATPTQCGTNTFATGVTAAGNANCVQPTFSNIGGTPPTWNQSTTGNAATASVASALTSTLGIAGGGTGQTTKAAAFNAMSPLTTEGDLSYFSSGGAIRLPVGTNGQCLTANGTDPLWGSCTGGTSYVGPITKATDAIWGVSTSNTAAQNQAAFATIAAAVNAGTSAPYIYLPAGTYTVLSTGASSTTNNALGLYNVPVTFVCENPATTIIVQSGTGYLIDFGPQGLTYPGSSPMAFGRSRFTNCGVQGGATALEGIVMEQELWNSEINGNLFENWGGGSFPLSSVATTSGGSTVYTGTISGGGSNAYAGLYFSITGFDNAANNVFNALCTASTATSLTLTTSAGVSDTHTATAAVFNFPIYLKGDTSTQVHDNTFYSNDAGLYHNDLYEQDTTGNGFSLLTSHHNLVDNEISPTNPNTHISGIGYWVNVGSQLDIHDEVMSGPQPLIMISDTGYRSAELHNNYLECYGATSTYCIQAGSPGGTDNVYNVDVSHNQWYFYNAAYMLGPSTGTHSLANWIIAYNQCRQGCLAAGIMTSSTIAATVAEGNLNFPGNNGPRGSYLPIGLDAWVSSSYAGQSTFGSGGYYNGNNWVATAAGGCWVSPNSGGANLTFYCNTGLTAGNTFTPTMLLNMFPSTGIANSSTDPGSGNFSWTGNFKLSKTFSTYNNLTTVGDGVAYNLGHTNSAPFNTTQSGTLITSPVASHDYTVHYSMWQAASGSGGTCSTNATAAVAVTWTDPSGTPQNQTFSAMNVPPTLAAGAVQSNKFSLTASSAAAIAYAVTWSGGNCTTQPTAQIHIWADADN